MEITETNAPQRESVKLIRNSRGYNWECRMVGTGENGLFTDEDMKRLKECDEKMILEYGSNEE